MSSARKHLLMRLDRATVDRVRVVTAIIIVSANIILIRVR